MPTDPQMPDNVSISPQQSAATNQIAQNVANSANAPAPTPAAKPENTLSRMADAFAMNFAGGNYIQQKLSQKYANERLDKEMSAKASLAKQEAERTFVMNGVQQYGSQFLQNPKLQKQLMRDPEEWAHYQALAQSVDHANQLSAQYAQQLGLPPALAGAPKQLAQAYIQQQQLKQKQQTEADRNALTARGQDITARGQNMRAGEVSAEINAANARNAANIASREKVAGERQNTGKKDTNYTRNTAATNEFTKLYPPPKGWFGLGGNKPGDKKYENQMNSWKIKERNTDPISGRMLKPTGIDVPKGVEDGYQTDPSDGKEYLIFEGKMYELL